jgi:hypothetical protein
VLSLPVISPVDEQSPCEAVFGGPSFPGDTAAIRPPWLLNGPDRGPAERASDGAAHPTVVRRDATSARLCERDYPVLEQGVSSFFGILRIARAQRPRSVAFLS